jgi:hypothetical protein
MPFANGGISSGDFKETSARVHLFHVVTRNSMGLLTPDAFTQANPAKGITAQKSSTLASITKSGVLGGSVAFTRDFANGYHGGPDTASYKTTCLPLGLYINDSLGNSFENTPGVASGRGPYVCGSGTTVGVSIYETKGQLTRGAVTAGQAITYANGDKLYASVNGLLTNLINDSYEQTAASTTNAYDATVIGVVKCAPDANSSLLILDLRV